MKIMKFCRDRYISILLLCVLLFISGCKGEKNIQSEISQTDKQVAIINSSQYIIRDPFYQIYETGLGQYKYQIGTDKKTFAKGEKNGTDPKIETVSAGIVRLFMGYGTNSATLQYFDVLGNRTSEITDIYTVYADYIPEKDNGECLLAYYDFGKKLIVIKDIFSKDGFYTQLGEYNENIIYNKLIILNENEIYMDYSVLEGETYKDERKTVKFR